MAENLGELENRSWRDLGVCLQSFLVAPPLYLPVVAPERKCWGASAVKVPIVSGSRDFQRVKSILLAKKTKKECHGYYTSVESAWNLGAGGGLSKILEG